jgi:hypothetical protein
MPQFAVVDGDEVDELVADGGINKKTAEARARIVGYVEKFLESKETPSNLDALVDLAATGDSAPLEAALMDFFAAYRVSGPDDTLQLPKRGTVDHLRSNIKVFVLNASNGKVNISDGSVFKRMERFFSGHFKQLKVAGRGEVKHTPGTTLEMQTYQVHSCHA